MLDPGRRAESTSSGALARRGDQPRRHERADVVGDPPAHRAMRLQATGRGRDQRDARDPLGEQLRVPLGEGDDRHAPHRVTDEDDLALRRHRLDHAGEVVTELVDGGVLAVAPLGAPVRALVVERHPVLAPERLALEVPAVEVEGVAVREDERHVLAGLAATSGLRVGVRRHLVDLRVQHHPVVTGHVDRVRAEYAESIGSRGTGAPGLHDPSLDHRPRSRRRRARRPHRDLRPRRPSDLLTALASRSWLLVPRPRPGSGDRPSG